MKKFGLFLLFIILQGCASEEVEHNHVMLPTVHPAAYAVDGFYLDVPTPVRERTDVNDFWIGGCGRGEGGSYYSKTSYVCPR